MRPSDEYRRQTQDERIRGKKVQTLRSVEQLVDRLEACVRDPKVSPAIKVQFQRMLLKLVPRRDALRTLLEGDPSYDWIMLKGVLRGLPLR